MLGRIRPILIDYYAKKITKMHLKLSRYILKCLKLTNLTNSTNTNQSQTSTASHPNIKINKSKKTYLEHWDQETKTQGILQFYWTMKSNYE